MAHRFYRLLATDTDWAVGDGPPINGPMVAILLLPTGRSAGHADLTGPGAAVLATTIGLNQTEGTSR